MNAIFLMSLLADNSSAETESNLKAQKTQRAKEWFHMMSHFTQIKRKTSIKRFVLEFLLRFLSHTVLWKK